MKKLILITTLMSGLLNINVYANDKALLPNGADIVKNINQRNEGISLSRSLRMEMTDKRGKIRIRETQAFRKYYGDDKRTAIFYLSPKNVKDTAFLTFDYADKAKDDDQWLYLPSMRKVRRISASDRGDYFLGTDFTYEEIKLETRVSAIDYHHNTIGEDIVDNVHCYIVEAITINQKITKELGHSRRQDCVDDNIWMVRRSILWDEKGKKLKTTLFQNITQVQGIWTAKKISVENHKTGHKTLFNFSNINFQQEIDDNRFTTRSLKRGL